MPGSEQRALIHTVLVLIGILLSRFSYYPYFTEEETEAKRN